ncbi:DNA binding protein HU [Bacillus phage 035JT004]|nr:DNA binding protein HU [Bacillus phage 035JT004]
MVNRKEIARRIAHILGYNIGEVEEVLAVSEDVIADALAAGEEVKMGKLYKLSLQELSEKRAFDGLNKRYFIREAKKVPKFKPLSRLQNINTDDTEE